MGAPSPDKFQDIIGRNGRITWHCKWDDVNNLANLAQAIVADREDLSTSVYGENVRFGVKKIKWVASANTSAQIYFNSSPIDPAGMILAVTPDSTTGERDFSGFPSGCMPDPSPESPSDIVVDTTNALVDDELFLELELKIKGTRS